MGAELRCGACHESLCPHRRQQFRRQLRAGYRYQGVGVVLLELAPAGARTVPLLSSFQPC